MFIARLIFPFDASNNANKSTYSVWLKIKRILQSKSLPIKESELGVSSGPKGGDVDSALGQNQQENSPGDDSNKSPFPRSDDSDGSEDDGPCVLMSFGNTLDKDNTDSPEQSPRKLQRGRLVFMTRIRLEML